MNLSFADFTDRLIPISEFSQGKASKIFADVAKNNNEYIILKNNQPTAVVISIQEYKKTQEMVHKLEQLLERVENAKLLSLAQKRKNDKNISFEELVKKEGFSLEELEELSETVDFE